MTDGCDCDAVELAARIRRGEYGAREVAEDAISRIEAINPTLNAVVHSRFDEALDEIAHGLPDGPLRGVPILIKDLGTDVAGLPATNGSRLFAGNRPERDSELVSRYRAAGMVVLGTTNAPEFGKNVSTEPVLFGPTRNPWSLSHSSGGSSGGSAAAVSAGMVPVAHGSDGGGSIRLPAAICGLFGLKPSRGRTSAAPHPDHLASPLTVHHVLTTSVRDSAALLDVATAPYEPSGQRQHYLTGAEATPGSLRIGYTTVAGDGTAAEPPCAAALARAAKACESLGHNLVPLTLRFDAKAAAGASATLMRANLAATVQRRLRQLGRELRDDDVEPFTRVMLDYGREMRAVEVMAALQTAERVSRQIRHCFNGYDLLLTPTAATATPRLGVFDTTRPESLRARAGALSAFTGVFNLTGQPAMSVPFGTDGTGLPVGAQFVGAEGDELLLLRLARQLERVSAWPRRAPPMA